MTKHNDQLPGYLQQDRASKVKYTPPVSNETEAQYIGKQTEDCYLAMIGALKTPKE